MSVGSLTTTPYREGKKRVFEDLEYYACCGFIRVHDRRHGGVKDVNLLKFQDNAFAIGEQARRCDHKEAYKFTNAANEALEACKEAAEMGNPLDKDVQEFHKRHNLYKRQYATVPTGTPGIRQRPSGLLIAS